MNIATFGDFFRMLIQRGLESFGLYYSVYRGEVVDNKDPKNLGRLKVSCYSVYGRDIPEYWAWPSGLAAVGVNSGLFDIPDVGDPVYLEFESGRPRYPIWRPGWYGRRDAGNEAPWPCQSSPKGKCWRMKDGGRLEFDQDEQKVTLIGPDGSCLIIDSQNHKISMTSRGSKEVDVPGQVATRAGAMANTIMGDYSQIAIGGTANITGMARSDFTAGKWNIFCGGDLNIQAAGTLNLSSQTKLNINAPDIEIGDSDNSPPPVSAMCDIDATAIVSTAQDLVPALQSNYESAMGGISETFSRGLEGVLSDYISDVAGLPSVPGMGDIPVVRSVTQDIEKSIQGYIDTAISGGVNRLINMVPESTRKVIKSQVNRLNHLMESVTPENVLTKIEEITNELSGGVLDDYLDTLDGVIEDHLCGLRVIWDNQPLLSTTNITVLEDYIPGFVDKFADLNLCQIRRNLDRHRGILERCLEGGVPDISSYQSLNNIKLNLDTIDWGVSNLDTMMALARREPIRRAFREISIQDEVFDGGVNAALTLLVSGDDTSLWDAFKGEMEDRIAEITGITFPEGRKNCWERV